MTFDTIKLAFILLSRNRMASSFSKSYSELLDYMAVVEDNSGLWSEGRL